MKVKKTIYILLTTVLGLLLSALVHAGIEILYIRNAIGENIALTSHPLFTGHYCVLPLWLQITVWAAGLLGGILLGFYWWRIVYIEKRRFGKHTKRKLFEYQGFTLIELLVVISIIGVLAATVLVSLNNARGRARDVRRIADLKAVITALNLFYDDYGRYPDASDGISIDGECIGDPCGNSNMLEAVLAPYLPTVPRDPLHNCTANPLPEPGAACATSYFYAYDFSHDVNMPGNCTPDPATRGDTVSGATIVSINRLEKLPQYKETCAGGDMRIHLSDYNIVLCRNQNEGYCFQSLL